MSQQNRGYKVIRQDVQFDSGETYCSAWLFLPEGVVKPPVVVLGHGIGVIREMRLDAFAERFAQAGIAALAFTYRYLGDSGGEPRQLMSVNRQLDDWEAALKFVKTHPTLDGKRLAIWGSSFGGGHAITIASRHPELKAAIAQCPFTDGLASASALGLKDTLKVMPIVMKDLVAKLFGNPPVMVPIAAPPGQPARPRTPRARTSQSPTRQRRANPRTPLGATARSLLSRRNRRRHRRQNPPPARTCRQHRIPSPAKRGRVGEGM